jgi:hypothetical protein
MQHLHRISLAGWVAGLITVSISMAAQSSSPAPQTPAPNSAQVAVVNAGAGPCTADFEVSDPSGKGIYAATIDIQIRYGFGGFHRVGATVKTNYQGKARVEGLPDKIKNTAEFKVSSGDQSKSLTYDPLGDCHPQHNVVLGGK